MIAIAGGKGGCGKTTTTLAVARALADRETRVRAVDLDTGMPNLHRLAGVDREPTLADLVRGGAVGQRDASGAEVVPAQRVTDAVDLDDALATLARRRPLTLLDCPAGAGPDATAPIRAAAAVVLVSTAEPESLEDAAKTGRVARQLDVPVLGAVVTRTDQLSERARSRLPTDYMVAVPEVDDPLADRCARDRYEVVADWLLPEPQAGNPKHGTATPGGRHGRVRATERDDTATSCGEQRSAPDTKRVSSEEPRASRLRRAVDGPDDHCQTPARDHRPHADAEPATRRRDRRSRRSRVAAGTRSSSRGGAAPSDPR